MGGKKELVALGLSLGSSTYRLWDFELALRVSESLLSKAYGFLCTFRFHHKVGCNIGIGLYQAHMCILI